jgi:hypothetical protein
VIRAVAVAVCLAFVASPAAAQVQMPNPKEISGVPLPAQDLPAGTVSVRVVRGSFASNLTDHPVEITVDGKTQTKKTDANGRAQVSGLKTGAKVRVATVVDGERLESQEITIGATGFRVVLVGVDPEAEKRAAEDRALAAGPPVKGVVVFGPESRVIAELSDDRLNLYYILEVLNTARTPVDTGAPIIVDLPHGARGAALLDGSAPAATVKGSRLTVTGPFPPGTTSAQVGFELPYDGASARIEQAWPAALSAVTVLVAQTGGLDLQSSQLTTKQVMNDQNQPVIFGNGPSLAAGQPLVFEITGLPHHARWPRYVALTLSGVILSAGLWAAFVPASRRRVA